MKRNNLFVIILIAFAALTTIWNAIFSNKYTIFVLNEGQLLYLFSTMAQVIGGMFGLTLTAYVFASDKINETGENDEEYYDVAHDILKKNMQNLIVIAIISGIAIALSVLGIIALHNWTNPYAFIIDESITMFLLAVGSVLVFGVMQLNPNQFDKEFIKQKYSIENTYGGISQNEDQGTLSDFLQPYKVLERLLIDFAGDLEEKPDQGNHRNGGKSQINTIQAISILAQNEILYPKSLNEIHSFRKYRNALVHNPQTPTSVPKQLCIRVQSVYEALNTVYYAWKNQGRDSKEFAQAVEALNRLQ